MNNHNKKLAEDAKARKLEYLSQFKKMKKENAKLSFAEFGKIIGISRQRITTLLKEAGL